MYEAYKIVFENPSVSPFCSLRPRDAGRLSARRHTAHQVPGSRLESSGDSELRLNKGRFWCRKSVEGGHEFVLADASTGVKAPAFGHERLAASLSKAANASGCPRKLQYVESSPPDQLQPKYMTIEYAKPGELLDLQQPVTNL